MSNSEKYFEIKNFPCETTKKRLIRWQLRKFHFHSLSVKIHVSINCENVPNLILPVPALNQQQHNGSQEKLFPPFFLTSVKHIQE